MNIAIFSDVYLPDINGVAVSVDSLFKLLTKYGHNAYVVTTSSEKEISFKDNILRIPGLELKKLYGYRASFIYNEKAFQILKKLKLDLCHINTEFGISQFGFIVASKLNIPSVYTYHTMYEDYTYYATKGYFDRFSKWAIREFDKSCMNRATEIISPSEKTKIYIRSVGVEKYVNVVPTGFNFDRFIPNPENKEKSLEIRRNLGFKDNQKILLCLGRIAKEKSFDIIIEGYADYLKKYNDQDTVLLFVGDGPARGELEALTQKLNVSNRIRFVGKVDNSLVPYYYLMSEVFLNASISETQGLTFMEAMASDLLVLCRFDNNLVGVIYNNKTGFFFQDVTDFKEKLHYVLSLNKEESDLIRKNAFESIDCFSEKTFYNNIIEVYKRAIRRSW